MEIVINMCSIYDLDITYYKQQPEPSWTLWTYFVSFACIFLYNAVTACILGFAVCKIRSVLKNNDNTKLQVNEKMMQVHFTAVLFAFVSLFFLLVAEIYNDHLNKGTDYLDVFSHSFYFICVWIRDMILVYIFYIFSDAKTMNNYKQHNSDSTIEFDIR